MKILADFYEENKKKTTASASRPRHRVEKQRTLEKYLKSIYNFRIKKLEEAEYFTEEWLEPEMGAASA